VQGLFPGARIGPIPDSLGKGGGLRAMRFVRYAPRDPRSPEGLQQALFAYQEVWGKLLGLPMLPTSAFRCSPKFAPCSGRWHHACGGKG
jgi:hypothetical protein